MGMTIGFVGYGEAGAAIAGGLAEEGATVLATDVRLTGPDGAALRARAAADGVTLVDDVAQLAARCPVIVSFVTAAVARRVAEDLAPHVGADHLVADANSTSPGLASEVAELLAARGATPVDVAVMAAVPPKRHRVPMLASGPGAERFAQLGHGTDVEVVDGPAGAASAVKMLRSHVVKGLEALLVEFAVASRHHGLTGEVLRSLRGTLPLDDPEQLTSYLLSRTALHAERRAHELEEVASMLRELGLEPLMADAGAKRLQWAAARGLADRFHDAAPTHYDEVVDALLERPVNRPE